MSTRATGTPATSPAARVGTAGQADQLDSGEPRRPRRLRVLLIAVAGAACLFWAAPFFVARHLTAHGFEFTGTDSQSLRMTVGGASCRWLSPVVLSDVIVHDLNGVPLVRIGSLTSQRQLWRLLADRTRPGAFFVAEPDVTVVVREDGSNLMDVLGVLSRRRRGSPLADATIRVSSGRLHVRDVSGAERLHVEDAALYASDRRSSERRFEFELTANGVQEGKRFPLQCALEWSGPAASDALRSGTGKAGLKFASLPLAAIDPSWGDLLSGVSLDGGLVSGQMTAQWDFTGTRKVHASGIVTIEDLHGSLAASTGPPEELHWPLEELTFELDGDYRAETDELSISAAHVRSSLLTVDAVGRMEDLRGRCLVDLTGDLQYDLATIVGRLSADGQEHVKIDGLQTRRFAVHGLLVREVQGVPRFDLSQVEVEADVHWERAELFGVQSEESTLIVRLADGVFEIEPRNVPVSGGNWRGMPRVDIQRLPALVEMKEGVVLENIEFSQEMCHQWLKFVSPPMAQAAGAQGRLSIALAQCSLPLDRPAAGRMEGTLSIHAARVEPGPFAEEILGLVAAVEGLIPGQRSRAAGALGGAWITFPEQDVDFRMVDGRVFHASLEFRAGSVMVRTSGSVGLDESLDLLLEIPVPEEWLRGSFLTDTLRGEVLRIPLQGTFQNPHFDRSAMREFAKRLATRAGEGLLRRLLDD